MLFKDIKQIRGKSEIALHKLRVILRAVYACKIKHKVRPFAKAVKQVPFGINIILKNFFYFNIPRSVLIIADIFQRRAKIFPDKALSAVTSMFIRYSLKSNLRPTASSSFL